MSRPGSRAERAEAMARACREAGVRMTAQRRALVEEICRADDHPDAAALLGRLRARGAPVSEATLYRSLRLLEERGVVARRDFGDGRARFEATGAHHDHLIDLETGAVVEFYDAELERLQERIARRLGYRLVDHRMELRGRPLPGAARRAPPRRAPPRPPRRGGGRP